MIMGSQMVDGIPHTTTQCLFCGNHFVALLWASFGLPPFHHFSCSKLSKHLHQLGVLHEDIQRTPKEVCKLKWSSYIPGTR